jgi:1-aminocyclopropane-1-carboxylate deaminase/D-cysteine desulfhydrase-like pyridoxal-dependent ACC family enzyme
MPDLSAQLDALPRISLASLPTPLERLPGISDRVGVEILIKRDDLDRSGLRRRRAIPITPA